MNKRRPTPPPLAKWTGAARKVRLALDSDTGLDLRVMLLTLASTKPPLLETPGQVARLASQTLAAEMLHRPAIHYLTPETPVRMTVSRSEALSLLAWLMGNPHTRYLPGTLLPLRDCLHQLLS